jgi:NAD(P)-dependent dehydrogenase (short-subunit alcohol dehydrogenase family)
LDVLVNNAAAVSSRYSATEDGYELTLAVNHLAPFLLSHELLPILRASPSPRVVTVSSGSHRHARIHWQDVMLRRGYGILRAYRQSKLANVMFTAEWNRRWAQGPHLRAYAADPGLVNTEIGLKGTHGLARWAWDRHRARGAPAEVGARTVIFLATDPGVEGSSEIYWRDCSPTSPDPYALRAEEAGRLWAISEQLCGIEPRDPLAVP